MHFIIDGPFSQDIPAPGVMHIRRTGPSLCIADTENYTIIDLQSHSQLPLHPISLSPTWKILPTIEVVQQDEYLMVACTGASDDFSEIFTMGLFVNGRGEPTRSPIEWGNAPDAVCVDGERVVSLHTTHAVDPTSASPSTRLEIRKAGDSNLLQSIPLPSSKISGDVKIMTLARDGFVAPVNSRLEKLSLVPVQLSTPPPPSPPPTVTTQEGISEGKKDKDRKPEDGGLAEPAGSGLTPPPTPKKPSRPSSSHVHGHTHSQRRNANGKSNVEGPSAIRTTGASREAGASLRFPTSRILLATNNSVMALVPSTILSQVEGMLEDGKVKDAAAFLAGLQGRHAKDEDLVCPFSISKLLFIVLIYFICFYFIFIILPLFLVLVLLLNCRWRISDI
jgi:vacuolar protein sorting-associated protein 3